MLWDSAKAWGMYTVIKFKYSICIDSMVPSCILHARHKWIVFAEVGKVVCKTEHNEQCESVNCKKWNNVDDLHNMIPLQKIKKIGITRHHCDRNRAFGNSFSLQHHQWNYITSENTPVWASFLNNTAARACLPFAMLDTSQIQEIKRIKNIIKCISLENMGQTQVDVRQRPGYKAVVL